MIFVHIHPTNSLLADAGIFDSFFSKEFKVNVLLGRSKGFIVDSDDSALLKDQEGKIASSFTQGINIKLIDNIVYIDSNHII